MESTRSARALRVVPVAFLVAVGVAVLALAAYAAVDLDEPFSGSTLVDPARWNASARDEVVCLTARDVGDPNITLGSGVVAGCSATPDTAGDGVLRLTRATGNQATTFLYNTPLPLADGLDITFSLSMWGGSGADGISFFLKDGANADDSPGAAGGSLGYGLDNSNDGIRGALVGIGFDRFGNFSTDGPALDCPAPNATTGTLGNSVGAAPNRVVVRGPDLSALQDGSCGYYFLDFSAFDFAAGANTRDGRARDVRVFVDQPSAAAPKIKVYIGNAGALPSTPTIEVDQPAVFRTTSTFKFGFSASTGGSTNNHEVWGLRIGAAVPPSPAGVWTPALTCTPDPYRTGETITCTVTDGPPDFAILWDASGDGASFATQGVTLDETGSGTFTFRAPGAGVTRVELVDWGVTTELARTGGPVPTAIPAGGGPGEMPAGTAVLLLVALAALGITLRARAPQT